MCGRFTETADIKKLSEELNIPLQKIPKLRPRYNIAPSQSARILLRESEKGAEVQALRWGLIPSWAKDPEIGYRMINARSETLATKPSFRGPLLRNRCLVIADGFYEWKKETKGRIPYYIRMKSGHPFTFAGLWSDRTGPDGSELRTFTIITTEPNRLLSPIHNRMPAIIPRKERLEWLSSENEKTEKMLSLLKPYDADEMETFPISTLVNSPKNDTEQCIQRLNLCGDKTLF